MSDSYRFLEELQFGVYVDDKKLPVYDVDGKHYIEANLHSKTSYIISEDDDEGLQKYPVTPFSIKGWFKNPLNVPCYIKLTIDGQQIWMKPYAPEARSKINVSGYRCGNEIRELLFTLPKLTSRSFQKDNDKKKLSEAEEKYLGTIRLECLEAVHMGYFQTWNKNFKDIHTPGDLPYSPKLKQMSKQDFKSGGLTTRDGRNVAVVSDGTRRITMTRYRLGNQYFGDVLLHYRTREMLQDLGVHDKAWEKTKTADKEKTKSSPSNQNKENETSEVINLKEKHIKQELLDTQTCVDSMSRLNFNSTQPEDSKQKMYCFSPSLNKLNVHSPSQITGSKLDCYSPSENMAKLKPQQLGIKKELFEFNDEIEDGKEYRYVEIDEDLYMLEEVDDDVVWMGDESCCFVDVPPEEIPLVDLCEEV